MERPFIVDPSWLNLPSKFDGRTDDPSVSSTYVRKFIKDMRKVVSSRTAMLDRTRLINSFIWHRHEAGHAFWQREYNTLFRGGDLSPVALLIVMCWIAELDRNLDT